MLTAVLVLVCFATLGLIMYVSTRGDWMMTEQELAEKEIAESEQWPFRF
jgi:hypothetical protein